MSLEQCLGNRKQNLIKRSFHSPPALISIPEEGRGYSCVIFIRYDAKLYRILQVGSHML